MQLAAVAVNCLFSLTVVLAWEVHFFHHLENFEPTGPLVVGLISHAGTIYLSVANPDYKAIIGGIIDICFDMGLVL
ncbi:hypothetical protein DSUL_50077 [Desulfovibrionales bacterium]